MKENRLIELLDEYDSVQYHTMKDTQIKWVSSKMEHTELPSNSK